MRKKKENSEKKAQQRGKKKEIEFHFPALRNGLSPNVKKDLIDFFLNAKQMFNQSKEELCLLNKRFDTLDYAFKALFKKECFDFTKVQIVPQIMSTKFSKEKDKDQEITEFVINEKYLASLFENENEEIKDNSNNKNIKSSSLSMQAEDEEEEDKLDYLVAKEKNKSFNRKQSKPKQKQRQDIEDNNENNFFDKDSDSFNNPRGEIDDDDYNNNNNNNNNPNTLEVSQSNDFNQQLFDYKSFTNSQSNKTVPQTKDQKGKN